MARNDLRLDLPTLAALYKDLVTVRSQFLDADYISRDLGGAVGGHHSPAHAVNDLASKVEDFAASWSVRREKIGDAMEALYKSVHAVDSTFTELDTGMSGALTKASDKT